MGCTPSLPAVLCCAVVPPTLLAPAYFLPAGTRGSKCEETRSVSVCMPKTTTAGQTAYFFAQGGWGALAAEGQVVCMGKQIERWSAMGPPRLLLGHVLCAQCPCSAGMRSWLTLLPAFPSPPLRHMCGAGVVLYRVGGCA